MLLKPGTNVSGMHFMLWWAAAYADWLHQAHGFGEATLTEGVAPRPTGLHPKGGAWDLRVWAIPEPARPSFAAQLAAGLGGAFDVVYEPHAAQGPHIHVELSPRALRA